METYRPKRLRWLYVDLNSFFASVEQELNPALIGKPVAVLPTMARTTSVIAASYEAKRFGIKTGTPVWEAQRRCPAIVFVQAQHEQYVRIHHQVVDAVNQQLRVFEVCSIDEVACELLANECEEPQAVALGHRIKQAIRQQVGDCLTSSVGIASNRFWAKVASDMQKPDGLTVLRPHDFPHNILGLTLPDLPGIGQNMLARFHRQGITRMDQLWRLDKQAMASLWGGVVGERFWYALHGFDLPQPATRRSTVGHSHVLSPSMRSADMARLVMRRLVVKAASRLRRLEHQCGLLQLRVKLENGTGVALETSFPATQNSFTLLKEADTLWHKALAATAGSPLSRVKKVGVVLARLKPQDAVQLNLFEQQTPNHKGPRQSALCEVMDRLNSRYGRDTVMVGFLPDLHRQDTGTKIAFTRIPALAEFWE